MKNRRILTRSLSFLLTGLLLVSGCGKKEAEAPPMEMVLEVAAASEEAPGEVELMEISEEEEPAAEVKGEEPMTPVVTAEPGEGRAEESAAEENKGEEAAKNPNDPVVLTKEDANKVQVPEVIENRGTVVLDPGHSGVMPEGSEPLGPGSGEMKAKDAVGTHGSASGLMEYQLTLSVCQKLRTELESRGYTVLMTREDHETAVSCSERAAVANNANADVFLRIHANGSDSTAAKGAMAICITPSNPFQTTYSACRLLSDDVLNAYCKTTGIANTGVLEEDNMTGNNWCSVPTTLIELGFMTNPEEDLLMASEDCQKKMVKGLADGIDKYMDDRS